MRPRQLAVSALLAFASTALLVGCSTPAPAETTEPTASTAAPVFASDEEAVAAAVEAYERYDRQGNAVLADQSLDPATIADLMAPGQFAEQNLAEVTTLRERGVRFVGDVALRKARLAERDENGGSAEVSIYVCRDMTNLRVVDSTGSDITLSDREDVVPQQAFFVSSSSEPEVLLVKDIQRWHGASFC